MIDSRSPAGMSKENVLPLPGVLWTIIEPRFNSTRSRAILSPSPSPFVPLRVWHPPSWNRSTQSRSASGLSPGPLSRTDNRTLPGLGAFRRISTTSRSGENLIALTTKLMSDRRNLSRSTYTLGSSSSIVRVRRMCFEAARVCSVCQADSTSSTGSCSRRSTRSVLARSLLLSRKSSTSPARSFVASAINPRYSSCCSVVSPPIPSARIDANSLITVRGVRNSCATSSTKRCVVTVISAMVVFFCSSSLFASMSRFVRSRLDRSR